MRDVVQPRHGVQPRVVLAVIAEIGDALSMRHYGAVAAVDQHLNERRQSGKMSKKKYISDTSLTIPLSRFLISATCGVNKNFYLLSLDEIRSH